MAVAKPRPSVAARRTGYVIAAGIHCVFLYIVNVQPGWEALPFLTAQTSLVVGLVNVSILANIVANLIYLIYDAPWWKAAGDLITTGIGLLVLIRIWKVFPFDFSAYSFDWTLTARLLLALAMAGAAIGIIAQFASLISQLGGSSHDRSERHLGSGV